MVNEYLTIVKSLKTNAAHDLQNNNCLSKAKHPQKFKFYEEMN